VLQPGVTRLARLAANQGLWDTVYGLLSTGQRAVLDSLLSVPAGARVSEPDRLLRGPVRISGPRPFPPAVGGRDQEVTGSLRLPAARPRPLHGGEHGGAAVGEPQPGARGVADRVTAMIRGTVGPSAR
jgi:hypothetical protein